MPDLTVHCTHCSAPLKLKDRSRLGSKVKCPKCGQPFVVQAGDDEWGDLEPAAPAPSGGRTAPVVSRSGGSKTSKKKRQTSGGMSGATKGLLIGGGVLVLLIIAGVGLWASGIFSSTPQGDAVAQSTPSPPTSPPTAAAPAIDPSPSSSQPALSAPATKTEAVADSTADAAQPTLPAVVATVEPQPASQPQPPENASPPAESAPAEEGGSGMTDREAAKIILDAVHKFVSQAVSPDNATVRKALVDFTADEQLTKRLFGPMGNDAWAISRKFNDEAFKEIPAARTALQAMGGADARFKLFNRRKAKNGPSMQALLAAMPAEAYIIECRVEVSQGGKRGLTDFLDCVLLDGEVRAIGSIELLLHELVERGKLVMPQIASRPLVPLDDAGKGFAGNTAGQTRNDNELQLMVVWCPPGKFRMGSSDQEQKKWGGSPKDSELTPAEQRSLRQRGSSATVVFSDGPDLSNEQQVDVELTSGFWIGQTEITREQWQRVMGTEPWKGSQWAKEGNGYPVISIVADDALDFCRRLTTQERDAGRLPAGWEYNLPTEAQWEYACRAGTETAFSFGDTADQLDEFEWTYRNCVVVGKDHPHPVAGKKPNVWGIYDMHGNVAEFCRDWYFDRISGGVDPLGAAIGDAHSARGGNWVSHEPSCRSAARSAAVVEAEINAFQGFRVAIVRSMVEETAK